MSSGLCVSAMGKSDPLGAVPWTKKSDTSNGASGRRFWWLKSVIKERVPLSSREQSTSELQTCHWASLLHFSVHFTLVLMVFFFLRQAAQDSPGCLGTHYVAPAVLKLRVTLLPQSPVYRLSVRISHYTWPLNPIISYKFLGCLLSQFIHTWTFPLHRCSGKYTLLLIIIASASTQSAAIWSKNAIGVTSHQALCSSQHSVVALVRKFMEPGFALLMS